MCLYPKMMLNRKYLPNKKNGGHVPAVKDNRTLYVPVACTKCIECKRAKARDWRVRLLEDIKTHKNGHMVTLTFSNDSISELTNEIQMKILDKTLSLSKMTKNKTRNKEIDKLRSKINGYELDNEIATLAIRRFTERWRKQYKKTIRHWLVTELGHEGTQNIHMHGLVWTNEPFKEVEKHWKYGWIWKGDWVNEATINYTVKYIHKQDLDHLYYNPKVLTSNGVGNNYTTTGNYKRNEFNAENTRETYKTRNGHEMTLPIYWRNKIYTEEQREQLWIQKLNKQKRYVLGEEIDISQNLEAYWKALEYYRKINKQLGYNDDKHNWKREEYEQQLRAINQQKRNNNNKKN